jgi:hypothetical protein
MDRDEVQHISEQIHRILERGDADERKAAAITEVLTAHHTGADAPSVKTMLIGTPRTTIPSEAEVFATLAYVFCLPASDYPTADIINANGLFLGEDTERRVPKSDVKSRTKRRKR